MNKNEMSNDLVLRNSRLFFLKINIKYKKLKINMKIKNVFNFSNSYLKVH